MMGGREFTLDRHQDHPSAPATTLASYHGPFPKALQDRHIDIALGDILPRDLSHLLDSALL